MITSELSKHAPRMESHKISESFFVVCFCHVQVAHYMRLVLVVVYFTHVMTCNPQSINCLMFWEKLAIAWDFSLPHLPILFSQFPTLRVVNIEYHMKCINISCKDHRRCYCNSHFFLFSYTNQRDALQKMSVAKVQLDLSEQ